MTHEERFDELADILMKVVEICGFLINDDYVDLLSRLENVKYMDKKQQSGGD